MPLRLTAFVLCFILNNAVLAATQATERHAVPVEVKRVLLDPVSSSPVVILEAVERKAIIPIWIGPAEAASIALELEQRKLPRPNTHDLIQHLLTALDAKLARVTVTELKGNTYFAVITIESGNRELHIDSRPSDAIAVALRTGAPIYAAPELFDQATGLSTPPVTPETNVLHETMGIQVQDLTAKLADLLNISERRGVLVSDVERNSVAARVGFERGDVITRVNGAQIHDTTELARVLGSRKGSRKVNFQVQRKGKPITVVMDLP